MLIKLFVLHFIADFLLQSRKMGKKKSIEFKWLFYHLSIQFFVFLPFTGWLFATLNILIHGLIDWNIWKLYKISAYYRLRKNPQHELLDESETGWKYWEDHWFYSTIGLDQLLHSVTLLVLARYFL